MADEVQVTEDGRRIGPGVILGALSFVALGLFIFQNTQQAPISFLFWEGDFPLWLLLIATIVLTVLVTLVGIWFIRRRD